MTYTVSIDEGSPVARFTKKRASRRDRARERRVALAMSEEGRILAQMRHHQHRHRHMAS